jgi:hypothetical protein
MFVQGSVGEMCACQRTGTVDPDTHAQLGTVRYGDTVTAKAASTAIVGLLKLFKQSTLQKEHAFLFTVLWLLPRTPACAQCVSTTSDRKT